MAGNRKLSGGKSANVYGYDPITKSWVPFNPNLSPIAAAWDFMSLATDTTTDVYTFKSGGSGGTLVATLTIVYTNATKTTISTVTKT